MPRPIADDCRRIEARQLSRSNGCVALQWGDIAFATLQRDSDAVKVRYRWRDEPGGPWREARQTIRLTYRDCPFGG